MKKFLIFFSLLLIGAYARCDAPEDAAFTMGDWNKDFYLDYISGVLAEQQDNPGEALRYYQAALKIYPQSETLKEDVVASAMRSGKGGDVNGTAEELAKIDTLRANTVYAQYAWGQGNLQTAAEYYEKALQKNPTDTSALSQYIVLLSKLDSGKAIDFLTRQAASYPEQAAGAYMQIAGIYLSKGRGDKALESYNKVTSIAPTLPDPYLARAGIYEKLKDYYAALGEYKQLEKMGKADETVFTRMGALNILLGNLDEARKNFEAVLKINPSSATANQFLAAVADNDKDYRKAVDYIMASSDYAANSSRQLQAAVFASKIPDNALALDILAKAYKSSGSIEMGYYYAVMLQEQKQYKEAVKTLEGVLKKSPDYTRAGIRLALNLSTLGEDKKFEKVIKKLYADNPEDAVVLNSYGYWLADKNKNLPLAGELIKKALDKDPGNPAYMDSYGWYLYRIKDYDGALEWLKKAKEKIGYDKDLAYHLEMVYMAKGEKAPQDTKETK